MQGQGRLPLGCVAVHVDEQGLNEGGVLSLAAGVVLERGQGEEDVLLFIDPTIYSGIKLLKRCDIDVLLLFC